VGGKDCLDLSLNGLSQQLTGTGAQHLFKRIIDCTWLAQRADWIVGNRRIAPTLKFMAGQDNRHDTPPFSVSVTQF